MSSSTAGQSSALLTMQAGHKEFSKLKNREVEREQGVLPGKIVLQTHKMFLILAALSAAVLGS